MAKQPPTEERVEQVDKLHDKMVSKVVKPSFLAMLTAGY